jgi:hypothetical protein
MNVACQLVAVEDLLARRIAGVQAGFTLVAGQHMRDPLGIPAVLTGLAPDERPVVAVLGEPPGAEADPAAAAAARGAAHALADDGFEVTEAAPRDHEQAIELWGTTPRRRPAGRDTRQHRGEPPRPQGSRRRVVQGGETMTADLELTGRTPEVSGERGQGQSAGAPALLTCALPRHVRCHDMCAVTTCAPSRWDRKASGRSLR